MKETLILLTSSFPYGNGETFLETELPFLSNAFSKIIILPTKDCEKISVRNIHKTCTINSSIVDKKNNENRFQRLAHKFWIALTFSYFYKELIGLFPNKINISVLDKLLTYSRDAVLAKKIITQIIQREGITNKNGIIYSYWCTGVTFGATLNNSGLLVISRIHRGDLYEELYSKNYIPYRTQIFSKISALFSISQSGINYLSNKYPAFKSKFMLSRLGIPIPPTITKINQDSLVVVSCSSINSNKRVDLIAKSLLKFIESNPDESLIWHHFGSGPKYDELKNIVNEPPKNFKAIFHGHIENKALIDWYRNNHVDLFINLSKSEGIPVSIMEANSFGIPALATNVGGTSELVSKENGWLINRDFTSKEIFNALGEALKDIPLRMQKSASARKICLTFFGSEKNYSEFAEIIKSIH